MISPLSAKFQLDKLKHTLQTHPCFHYRDGFAVHNMSTDCLLNYKFNTWKFQAQTWGEHVVYRNCFWHSEQFLYTTCSPHVLQKEELLTKICLHKQLLLKCYKAGSTQTLEINRNKMLWKDETKGFLNIICYPSLLCLSVQNTKEDTSLIDSIRAI